VTVPTYKGCPSCGGEFQSWVEMCPDCELPLQVGPVAPRPVAPPAPELPPARELHCLRTGDPWHLREISEALQEAGIAHRIDRQPAAEEGGAAAGRRTRGGGRAGTLGLFVRREDVAAAAQVEHDLHLGRTHGPETVAHRPGDALEACPACGEALPRGASACGGCGLEFPEEG
jgi:hypothetical protein